MAEGGRERSDALRERPRVQRIARTRPGRSARDREGGKEAGELKAKREVAIEREKKGCEKGGWEGGREEEVSERRPSPVLSHNQSLQRPPGSRGI